MNVFRTTEFSSKTTTYRFREIKGHSCFKGVIRSMIRESGRSFYGKSMRALFGATVVLFVNL